MTIIPLLFFIFAISIFISISSTVITPNLGWYAFPYQGIQISNFIVNTDRILFVTFTGCNCQGDQLFLMDNGIPLVFFGNCNSLSVPEECIKPVSSPWSCALFDSGNDDTGGLINRVLSAGGRTKALLSLDEASGILAEASFCLAGGFLMPGRHNLTAMSVKTNYPFNIAYIRTDEVCNQDGFLDVCCLLENQTSPDGSCSDAIIG